MPSISPHSDRVASLAVNVASIDNVVIQLRLMQQRRGSHFAERCSFGNKSLSHFDNPVERLGSSSSCAGVLLGT
ncbi:hypothetical protein X900_5836 [Burkholderia pseudomallei BDU 2]|nr:hypothetical protein X900_5836 [Burkholderia pseudomallei BDU 2]